MRSECIPLAKIPHTTALYRDSLSHSPKVQDFYASLPSDLQWRRAGATRNDYPQERRLTVAAILERQNRAWDASPAALANIERLRNGASVVVTGQQVTLFGGPLFSLLKAITAIKLAREASAAGHEHVPVFWMATEDHDFAEINHVSLPASFSQLTTLSCDVDRVPDAPVGGLRFDSRIESVLSRVAEIVGDTEITEILRESYAAGNTLSDAYARLFTRLMSQHGLILMDASDSEFHAAGSRVFHDALKRHEELAGAIEERNRELERVGYHVQVNSAEGGTLLFLIDQGQRHAIRKTSAGFRAGGRQFTLAELESEIKVHPEQFSANVLLRPVFQDYLLPTSAYIGGPAEISYFAQADVVYRVVLGRTTPVLPRLSATLVEPRVQHWLERYRLPVSDVLIPADELERRLGAQAMPIAIKQKLSSVGESLHRELQEFEKTVGPLDPTLLPALERSGSKMLHQMNRLRRLAAAAEVRKNADLKRHANSLSTMLYPNGHLQEREIGGVHFLGRYGIQLIQQILDTVKTTCTDHQVFYL